MLVDTDLNISDPYERDIFTRILSPILASQAPIVSRIRAKVEIFSIEDIYRNDGTRSTRVSIIPSKHKRAISK